MSSYLKSEFYRLIHYKWTYLFIGICSVLLLSSNIVLAVVRSTDSSFPYATTKFSFSNAYNNMPIVFILCIMLAIMIFGNEHNNHTMKNCVTYGIPRGTIYLGKFLVQIAYAIIAFMIIIGVHILSGYLLLENSGPKEFELLIRTSLACLPFFIFGLATTNAFVFILEGVGSAVSVSCGIMLAFPLICNLLGMRFQAFEKLGGFLPWNIMSSIEYNQAEHTLHMFWDTATGFRNCWVFGIIQTVLIVGIGYLLFRKKEIK
ncbi:MAG TPA: ABC transporter permease [Ruminiclostridium sp.]